MPADVLLDSCLHIMSHCCMFWHLDSTLAKLCSYYSYASIDELMAKNFDIMNTEIFSLVSHQ